MGKNKKAPQHAQYEQMADTPWITQGREIADIGGKGILNNYNRVNVFDDATRASLDARNNETYKRAFDEMGRNYTNIMNKYNAANYNQFGTLNATAPSFTTDQYRRDFQRQMNDMSYNKAAHYDELMDNELARRYNTLDMFNSMYDFGETPYQLDLANWNIRNTNKDVDYENAKANYYNNSRRGFSWKGALQGAGKGASAGSAAGPWGALAGGVAGGVMGGFSGGNM